MDNRPTTNWQEAWTNSSPVLLRLALDQEQDKIVREQIIESIGGQSALDLLEKSANWYAMGQTKSPLDWRLLWGRCFANLVCDRNEVAKLLPASLTLSKHNPQQLLAADLLFPEQFDPSQEDQILSQAMKSNVWTATNAARLLASKRADNEIPITIFPPKCDVLRSVATEAFIKDRFPNTHKLFWEKSVELLALTPMTKSNLETWKADASIALDDPKGEFSHLSAAVKIDPNNATLLKRFAGRLLEATDLVGSKAWCEQAYKAIGVFRKRNPNDLEAQGLEDRLKKQLEQ
jgi:hypothetical protein